MSAATPAMARASHTWNGVATTPTSISGAAISQHTSGGGFVGGGQLGCDYQSGNWVIGIEGMGDGSTINKTTGINLAPGATFNDKVTSFETVTARIGWASDRTLLYAKAGGAWDQSSGTINGSALGLATESHSINNSGWVVGGGVEYAFAPNWSGKVEYDYMGFGNQTVNYPITTAGPVYIYPPKPAGHPGRPELPLLFGRTITTRNSLQHKTPA